MPVAVKLEGGPLVRMRVRTAQSEPHLLAQRLRLGGAECRGLADPRLARRAFPELIEPARDFDAYALADIPQAGQYR